MYSIQPLINSIIKDITPLKIRSVVFGLNFFLMFGLSGLAAYLGGIIADNYSFKLIFPIFSLLFPLGVLLLYILNMKRKVENLMLVSMTGFGSSSFEDSNLSINVELKSFNSRYFELNTKSFDLSGPLEYKIRNYLKKHLLRGSVTLFIKVDSKNAFKLNSQKTSSVLKAYKEIEKKYGIDLNYSQLLRNNDILSFVPHNSTHSKKNFFYFKNCNQRIG